MAQQQKNNNHYTTVSLTGLWGNEVQEDCSFSVQRQPEKQQHCRRGFGSDPLSARRKTVFRSRMSFTFRPFLQQYFHTYINAAVLTAYIYFHSLPSNVHPSLDVSLDVIFVCIVKKNTKPNKSRGWKCDGCVLFLSQLITANQTAESSVHNMSECLLWTAHS